MLTGLFFLAGLAAFLYICWWTYLNDQPGASELPRLGLLAMKTAVDDADKAQDRKAPGWKRKGSTAKAVERNMRRRFGR